MFIFKSSSPLMQKKYNAHLVNPQIDIERPHRGNSAAWQKFYMVCAYRSPIPGGGGILLVQMISTCLRCAWEGGGDVSTLRETSPTYFIYEYIEKGDTYLLLESTIHISRYFSTIFSHIFSIFRKLQFLCWPITREQWDRKNIAKLQKPFPYLIMLHMYCNPDSSQHCR